MQVHIRQSITFDDKQQSRLTELAKEYCHLRTDISLEEVIQNLILDIGLSNAFPDEHQLEYRVAKSRIETHPG